MKHPGCLEWFGLMVLVCAGLGGVVFLLNLITPNWALSTMLLWVLSCLHLSRASFDMLGWRWS